MTLMDSVTESRSLRWRASQCLMKTAPIPGSRCGKQQHEDGSNVNMMLEGDFNADSRSASTS